MSELVLDDPGASSWESAVLKARAEVRERHERMAVVRIAHEWLRTPFVHQGRLKFRAADCTFLAMIYIEAGLMPESLAAEIPNYSAQGYLNRSSSIYLALVARHAKREIEQAQTGPGDMAMYRIGRTFAHGAVIDGPGWPRIINASRPARAVIEGEGDQADLAGVERRFFSLW